MKTFRNGVGFYLAKAKIRKFSAVYTKKKPDLCHFHVLSRGGIDAEFLGYCRLLLAKKSLASDLEESQRRCH